MDSWVLKGRCGIYDSMMVSVNCLGVSWFVWAGSAALIAVIFTLVVVPKQTKSTSGATHFALRWCHGIAWALLSLSFLVRALSDASAVSDLVGLTGLATYIAFVIAATRTRRLP